MGLMNLARAYAGEVQWRRVPWALLALALALTGVGTAFVWSAASRELAARQAAFAAVGCAVFAAVAAFDYRHLRGLTFVLYLAGLAGLMGLWTPLGTVVNGARRWYDFGPIHAQPSEPMKLVLVLALADQFSNGRRWRNLRDLIAPGVMTAAPMLLIATEPDFGTALLLVPVFLALAFLGGARVRSLVLLIALGCVALAAAWLTPGALKQYQKDRVLAFLWPSANPDSSASYNADQAMLAICAGGPVGQGWGRGVLNRLGRVPERETDFIFPVIAEEWGFARTAPLILLYIVLMGLLAGVALKADEPFGRLVAGGVLVVFGVQTLLHVAISLRLAPITGLTLPLASYGGSSLVTTYAGFGLAASVNMHRTPLYEPPVEAAG